MTDLAWRAMTPGDLDGVAALALLAFPDHFEDRACFSNRLSLHPSGCRVLSDAAGPAVGYMIAYPWRAGDAPPLNTRFDQLPPDSNLIYLHDLALHPDVRGAGWPRPAIDQLATDSRAAGWRALALVAVNGAEPFWLRHGFHVERSPGLARKLESYGGQARYMVRPL